MRGVCREGLIGEIASCTPNCRVCFVMALLFNTAVIYEVLGYNMLSRT
jgi:hypothetical protein